MRINGMRRNSPLAVIFCLFLLVSWNTFAEAQLTKLKVGYSAISEVDLPAWVAKEARIFEKNGLDVQLIYFTGGTTAVLALVSGEVPISQVVLLCQ
jgi:ABC-type nitrate/sulfonate/bicarbonate transport system substrate-binding protein